MSITGAGLAAACAAPAAAPTVVPAKPAATGAPAAPAASAVSSPATSASPAAGASPAAAAVTPKKGGTLRWGMVGDITTTDAISWSPVHNETLGQVAESVMNYDDNLKAQPRLAESWEFSTDNKQIKLNLRKGVTFHSGREFTSEDFNYNLLRARDPKNPFGSQVLVGSGWWTGVEMPDKHTVILKSELPRPGAYDFLQQLRIQDKDVREGPDANTKVGGTGPFKWVEWKTGQSIEFARNANYWDTPKPYLDGYVVTIFRDQQSMIAALEAGTLDVAALAPIPDAVRLRTNPSFKIYETHDLGQFFHATMSAINGPTAKKEVRQALGYAIDRKRFTDQIMRGFVGEPRALPWAISSPAFDAAKNNFYTFDLEKARTMLAAAGASNIEFDIAWATAGFQAEYAQLAQILQSDFAKIGVKTNLKPTDPGAFTVAGNGTQPPFSGMRLSAGAFAAFGEASSEFVLSRGWGYASNSAGHYDPAWEAMCKAAATEPDPAKRKVIYNQINDYMLDIAYVQVISAYSNIMAMKPNVMDLKYEQSTRVLLHNIWMA